ncbi:MAG TPA: pyruvate kinase [Ilumatobacter sp.]|nr:pyruvate kinase [Ilumatobacter sp.]
MQRRTKIVATIGPASSSPDVLTDMIRAGMDVARVSLAHTPRAEALELHARVREVADRLGANVATMIDLPGPLIRIGRPAASGVELVPNETITLLPGTAATTAGTVYVGYEWLLDEVRVGDRLNIGEAPLVEVTEVAADRLIARVLVGGRLTGRAAMRLPRQHQALPIMTAIERDELAEFVAAGVDIVALSARTGADLDGLGLTPIPTGPMVFAKVESMEAVGNLASLVEHADGIIIGRGGLGLECPLEDLPHLQKRLTEDCIASGLPVVTSSQVLDSMIDASIPTRAETTDISNAVFDGTSGLMLSSETAVGAHPALVVATMARIAGRADEQFDHRNWSGRVAAMRMVGLDDSDTAVTDAITIGAARAVDELGLRTLLGISATGFTVRSMARFRPRAQILGVSKNPSTVRQLAASWGVTPLLYDTASMDYEGKVTDAIERAREAGLVEPGELVGVVAGIATADHATDTFRFVRVP